jgi:SulP family sulfate permease
VSWIRSYGRDDLRGDAVAGLTVGVMLIPQAMAYALLAGVPPIYGLYASLVPLVVYAAFGTSRHLAVGMQATDSLIVFAALSVFAEPMSGPFVELVILVALLTGVIQVAMGIARFGFVVALLSRPVIAGFTAAVAVTIVLSQLQSLLGIPLPRTTDNFVLLAEAVRNIGQAHLATVAIGVCSIFLVLGLRRWLPVVPGALVAVVLGSLVVWRFGLDGAGVRIVGDVPRGLAAPSLPPISLASIQVLFPTAVTLSLIQFMNVVSLGKVFGDRNRYTVDANRELVALGVMNVAGSLFRSLPVSGSFSRTAVGERAGARTPMANVVAALLIALTLLFLTPLFYYLPVPVFAAIIVVAAAGLVDVEELRFLLRSKRVDGLIGLLTFAATLVIGIQNGVFVGIGASVVAILFRIGRPYIAELGHVAGTQSFADIRRVPGARRIRGLYIVRVHASFGFVNADYVRDHVIGRCDAHPDVTAVLIDASSFNDLDTTAAGVLQRLVETLSSRGVEVYFAGMVGRVRDVIVGSGLEDAIGADHFFLSLHEAVRSILTSRVQVEEFDRACRERTAARESLGVVEDDREPEPVDDDQEPEPSA